MVSTILLARPSYGVPYLSRRFQTGCQTCHSVVPKLNQVGLDFKARGNRFPDIEPESTIPLSAWIGGRYENRTDAHVDRAWINKVEIIGGGDIGSRASYFVEWRAVSLGLQNSGELSDRSGRFEDLLVALDLAESTSLTVGQYRHFNQFDNSSRLSSSTPLALGAAVPGERQPGDSDRQAALRAYSPVGRSPSFMLTHHVPRSAPGANFADGWYFHGSVPFPGELSIPLTEEARQRASFELDGRVKGFVAEAYYRYGLSSAGGQAFLGRDSQLYTGLFNVEPGRWNTTFAIGTGIIDGEADRRLSWWSEYRPHGRINLGFRLDEASFSPTAFTLYGDFQIPVSRSLLWLLVEQRFRDEDNRTIVQLSSLF